MFWADADEPDRWYPVPAAVPVPGPIKEAVLAGLSVWFSATPRPKQPDQQPLLLHFAVRLCQLPQRRQPSQTHGRLHAPLAHASGSRTFKDLRPPGPSVAAHFALPRISVSATSTGISRPGGNPALPGCIPVPVAGEDPAHSPRPLPASGAPQELPLQKETALPVQSP